jgi:hypothetical protein
MKAKSWLAAVGAAAFLGVMPMGAQAAPVGSATTDMRTTAGEGVAAEPVHYYRRHRHRHHRHYGLYYGAPYWGYYGPYYRRYYSPGVHFYIGPRRHRHWHRHYWW